MKNELLLTAGPVPLSAEIREILSRPMVYHRTPEFIKVYNRLSEGLKYLFQTKNDVLILATSGTGGMEAAVANFFSPGDEILVVENGKFSERWSEIAREFGFTVKALKLPWGKSPTLEQIIRAMDKYPLIKGIYFTHCETSTGALTDLATIVPKIRNRTDGLIIADVITSAGILPLKQDEWGVDVVVGASQKALGLPPGLSMISLNDRAWEYAEQAKSPCYYLDLKRAKKAYNSQKGAAYTPVIPLIFAADHVIGKLQKTGIEKNWKRRHEIAQWFRDEILGLSLSLFPEYPADSLTVIDVASKMNPKKMISHLKQNYKITVSGGQGKLSDKVFRVGHMVNVDESHLNVLLDSLKKILYNLN